MVSDLSDPLIIMNELLLYTTEQVIDVGIANDITRFKKLKPNLNVNHSKTCTYTQRNCNPTYLLDMI